MIPPGSRLGPYEITAQLGAGGMGEVYRARDSRLDRTVAIKVLPDRFSSDPRLRERFEREAKAISALTHPHICTLYDIGRHDGTDYLVMEYLDGESLADRLSKGPLPIEQVIRYGTEIAEALEKAHRAGIVHRDLKPGNIVLTKGGAKLLDFGLAKFAQPLTDPNAATAAMTHHQKPLTEEGSLVGTFQYMAPEQIEGRDADPRTDIFALGAVLYEMATGKRAFEAKTRASLIASILDREPPPISAVQPLTPPAFERVVRMCLAKEPDERWQSAHDVGAELKWIATTSSETIGPGAKRRTRRTLLRGAAILVAGALLGALATWLLTRRADAPAPRPARFSIMAAPNAPVNLRLAALAISPDGNSIVYSALQGDSSKLFLRTLDSAAAVPIAGTDDGDWPVFSSDGRFIAFVTGDALWRVPREGGTPAKIQELEGLGYDWEGDTIIANRNFSGGLVAVPAAGGPIRQIVTPDPKKERAIVWPDVLPGGQTVIATVWNAGSWDTAKIVAYSVKDGSSKVLIDGGFYGRYSATGHLLFMRGETLMAAAFDPKSLRVGNPVPVVRGVAHGTAEGEAHYVVSPAGHLVYIRGGASQPNDQLLLIDRNGKAAPLVPTVRRYGSVAVSPDGRTAAVTIQGATFDIWQLDLERDALTRVSYGGDDADAIWTPDGNRLIWASSRNGPYDFFWRGADNSTSEEPLPATKESKTHLAISPDGRYILFTQRGKGGDIWMMPMATRKPQPLVASDFDEGYPAVSPDGRWLAYASIESGRPEVYLTSFPTPAGKWQVSIEGGMAPKWMPGGRELVFHNRRKWYIVPIETSPRPRAGKPRLIFEGDYDEDYDITPDGRIAIVKEGPRQSAPQMEVVLNWGEELKRVR